MVKTHSFPGFRTEELVVGGGILHKALAITRLMNKRMVSAKLKMRTVLLKVFSP